MTPPITTVASGRWTSAPTLVFNAIGTNPNAATSAVIMIGRRRSSRVSSIASSTERPSSSILRRIVETSTRPLSTDTPETATKPTPAEIVNGNEELTVTHVQLVVHGREIERAARIAPGESRRIAMQYLFPEDPDFGSIDPGTVEWELVGATGRIGEP